MHNQHNITNMTEKRIIDPQNAISLIQSEKQSQECLIASVHSQNTRKKKSMYSQLFQSSHKIQRSFVQKSDEPYFISFNTEQSSSNSKIDMYRLQAPWMSSETSRIRNPILRFHNEVVDFYNYMKPEKLEQQRRMTTLNQIKSIILGLFPKAEVYPFGSFVTELYLPDGDIDIVVLTNQYYIVDDVYEKLFYVFRKNPFKFTQLEYIRGAKVPIIKFICGHTKYHFDISVDQEAGLKQLEIVSKINETYPQFKYLVFVFKCFLKIRELSETHKGGMGSFLLFCLLHVYLQQQNRRNQCNCTLGQHIIKFMSFYADQDWSWKVIYLKDGVIEQRERQVGTFSCISPQDGMRDIGRVAFCISDIFGIFRNRLIVLKSYNFGAGESILAKLINPSGGQFKYFKKPIDY